MSDEAREDNMPALAKAVDDKLAEVEEGLKGADKTLAWVQEDVRATRLALKDYYAAEIERKRKHDAKR